MNEPTHCPFCKRMVTGETRSFCRSCLESFPEVESRWFSTQEHSLIDCDNCALH